MKLNDLKPAPGSKKARRRVGRGLGSGRGKTAGRGQKGQKSRSGFSQGSGWEGGRSRLVMRLPKRGFTRQGDAYQIVNLADLNTFAKGAAVNAETLKAAGLIKHLARPVKLLGNGELTAQNLQVQLDAYSKSAVKAVEAAGGTVMGGPENATEPGATESKRAAKAAVPKQEQQVEASGAETLTASEPAQGEADGADEADEAAKGDD